MRLILSSGGGALCGLLFLAACSTGAAQLDAVTEPASAPCAAAEWQTLVGQIAGEVDLASLPQPSRLLNEGESGNELDLSRMTLTVGPDGRVSRVDCR